MQKITYFLTMKQLEILVLGIRTVCLWFKRKFRKVGIVQRAPFSVNIFPLNQPKIYFTQAMLFSPKFLQYLQFPKQLWSELTQKSWALNATTIKPRYHTERHWRSSRSNTGWAESASLTISCRFFFFFFHLLPPLAVFLLFNLEQSQGCSMLQPGVGAVT